MKHDITDPFLRAYIESALWTTDPNPGSGEYGRAPELIPLIPDYWIAEATADCAKFKAENADMLARAGTDSQNGHDFWLTRNGHGAGFWDRGYPDEIGDGLSDAARAFGEVWLEWESLGLPSEEALADQLELASGILEWHGGQDTGLYAVGSCMLGYAQSGQLYKPEDNHGHADGVQAYAMAVRELMEHEESAALAERLVNLHPDCSKFGQIEETEAA